VEEFAYRFNNRKSADLFGMTVARMAENLFIHRGGRKISGCVNLHDIQPSGELRIQSVTSDWTIDPAIEATLRPPKKLGPTAKGRSILFN